MKSIKIGHHTFSVEYLQSVNLTDAKAHFKNVKPEIVKEAHSIANPKRKKKKQETES